MAARAMYTGVEPIMNAFEGFENSFFSVWLGKEIIYSHNSDDIQQAQSKLMEILRAAEQSGNSDILAIKFHPSKENKWISDKTPVIATLFVRVVPLDGSAKVAGVNNGEFVPYAQYKAMQAIEGLPAMLNEKFSGFEQRLADLETNGVGAADDEHWSVSLLKNPAVMSLVGQILPTLLPAILPGMAGMPKPNMQVAGIEPAPQVEPFSISQEDATKLENALARLGRYCDLVGDITALADLAESKPELFKMMLSQLKNM